MRVVLGGSEAVKVSLFFCCFFCFVFDFFSIFPFPFFVFLYGLVLASFFLWKKWESC